jgi:hypothetical protein
MANALSISRSAPYNPYDSMGANLLYLGLPPHDTLTGSHALSSVVILYFDLKNEMAVYFYSILGSNL